MPREWLLQLPTRLASCATSSSDNTLTTPFNLSIVVLTLHFHTVWPSLPAPLFLGLGGSAFIPHTLFLPFPQVHFLGKPLSTFQSAYAFPKGVLKHYSFSTAFIFTMSKVTSPIKQSQKREPAVNLFGHIHVSHNTVTAHFVQNYLQLTPQVSSLRKPNKAEDLHLPGSLGTVRHTHTC